MVTMAVDDSSLQTWSEGWWLPGA